MTWRRGSADGFEKIEVEVNDALELASGRKWVRVGSRKRM
jgi:hypothetical protein